MATDHKTNGDRRYSRIGKSLFVNLRGTFSVTAADGTAVKISSARGAAILIYLCLADGCKVTRNVMARQLWRSDGNGHDRRSNLRQDLSVLRQRLHEVAPEAIGKDNEAIWLDLSKVWIDVKAEEAHFADPRQPLPEWVVGPRELLSNAVEIDADFDGWLADQRAVYAGLRSRWIERRAHALQQVDLPIDTRVVEYRALADCDPQDQLICQRLMECLAFAGTAADITRAYKRCQDACIAQGDEPAAETTATRDEALARRRSLGGALVPAARGGNDIVVRSEAGAAPSRAYRIPGEFRVGVRSMVNRSGDAALDRVTSVLHSNLMVDLDMIARPFSFFELAPGNPLAGAITSSCGCIVALGLELLCREAKPMVGVNIEITCSTTGMLLRGDRATLNLSTVLDDPRLFSNIIANKIHFNLVFNLHVNTEARSNAELSGEMLVVRGQMLLRRRNTVENLMLARAAFGAALQKDANNFEALIGLAHVLHRFGSQPGFAEKPREALIQGGRLIETVLERDPDNVQANYISAIIHSAQERPEQTDMLFARMLNLTSHARALTYRGYNSIFLDQPKRGLDDFEHAFEALKGDGSMPIWHFFKGLAHFHCGDLTEAKRSWQLSLQLDPGYTSAKLWLAGSEQIDGATDEALTHMEQFRAAFPAYTLADFEANWGAARTRNAAYLSRTRQVADALKVLELPQAR